MLFPSRVLPSSFVSTLGTGWCVIVLEYTNDFVRGLKRSLSEGSRSPFYSQKTILSKRVAIPLD